MPGPATVSNGFGIGLPPNKANPMFKAAPQLRLPFYATCLVILMTTAASSSEHTDPWSVYVDGGYYNGGAPSESPDGRYIVFSSPRSDHGDIYQWDRTTSSVTQLTSDPRFEKSPLYFPSGEAIAFSRNHDGRHCGVNVLNLKSHRETEVTSGKFDDDPAEISADGKYMIVRRGVEGGGLGIVMSTVLIEWARPSHVVQVGESAAFGATPGTVYYSSVDDSTQRIVTWSMGYHGEHRRRICDGNLVGVVPRKEMLLLGLLGGSPLDIYDVVSGKTVRVSTSQVRSVTSSMDGSVILFTNEFGKSLQRFRVSDRRNLAVVTPAGAVYHIQPCAKGFLVVVVDKAAGDRGGTVYLLDSLTWRFRKLFEIAK
jgi:Tol biopolymer transport system component